MRNVFASMRRDAEWTHVPSITTASKMSLTRRGRFVFFGLPVLTTMLVGAVLLTMFFGAGTANAGTEDVGSVTKTVTVGSGDTLWDIAHEADPTADTRETIAKINDLNDLASGRVTPGQRLIVPVISEG